MTPDLRGRMDESQETKYPTQRSFLLPRIESVAAGPSSHLAIHVVLAVQCHILLFGVLVSR